MKEIHREHYNGNTFTIPKDKQENLDNYDKFCAYLKNCAASSGFQFVGIGVEISRCVEAWNRHIGYEKARKKEVVINDIMTIDGAFLSFKKWFHEDYIKRNLYA